MNIIFLDRDGVVNHDEGYTYKIDDFSFIDGVFEACKKFNELGFEIIIVTNQSGINRGYYTQNDFDKLTSWMLERFEENGVKILDVFFCPHSPEENCNCRKPKIGMIQEALKKYDIDLNNSWLIGDKQSDIKMAINANIPNKIYINNEKHTLDKNINSYIAKNLFDTISLITNKAKNEI